MLVLSDPSFKFRLYLAAWLTLILGLLSVLHGCGRDSDTAYGPTPTVPPPANPTSFADVQPVIQRDCGPCHGVRPGLPVFDSEAKFRAGGPLNELQTGGMPPPPATISDGDKAALLAYLQRTP